MATLADALATSRARTSLPCATSAATFTASAMPTACTALRASGPPACMIWAACTAPITPSRKVKCSPSGPCLSVVSPVAVRALVDSRTGCSSATSCCRFASATRSSECSASRSTSESLRCAAKTSIAWSLAKVYVGRALRRISTWFVASFTPASNHSPRLGKRTLGVLVTASTPASRGWLAAGLAALLSGWLSACITGSLGWRDGRCQDVAAASTCTAGFTGYSSISTRRLACRACVLSSGCARSPAPCHDIRMPSAGSATLSDVVR